MNDAAIIVQKEISIVEIGGEDAVVVERDVVHVVSVGIQGPPGPSGDGVLVFGEVPAGAINGSNATFVTEFEFVPESVQVFINGLAQIVTEGFITSGQQTIMLSVSPLAGEKVSVNYLRG